MNEERLLHILSHDLNEPLRKINAFSGLLERHLDGQLDEKGERYLAYIQDGGTRMAQMLAEVLYLSRIGRLEDNPRLVNTQTVVDHLANHNGLQCEANDLPRIWGVEEQVVQMFSRLLDNVAKHGGKKCRVTATDGKMWTFSVEDSGPGIPEENRDRALELFGRLEARAAGDGPAASLAVCEAIAKRWGGEFSLGNSDLGGLSVTFTWRKESESS